MAQMESIELRNMEGGFVTEHNYLDVPVNKTLDEYNFNLDPRGVRRRRLGVISDPGTPSLSYGDLYDAASSPTVSSYLWENAGGFADLTLLVVQYNNKLVVFTTGGEDGDINLISQPTGIDVVESTSFRRSFDYSVVDGDLIVVTGEQEVNIISLLGISSSSDLSGATFSIQKERLLIRDTFGFDVIYTMPSSEGGATVSLQDPRYKGVRPEPSEQASSQNLLHSFSITNVAYNRRIPDRDLENPPFEGITDIYGGGGGENQLPETLNTTNPYAKSSSSVINNSNWAGGKIEGLGLDFEKSQLTLVLKNSPYSQVIINGLPVVGTAVFNKTSTNLFTKSLSTTQILELKDWLSGGVKRDVLVNTKVSQLYTDYTYSGFRVYLEEDTLFKQPTFGLVNKNDPLITIDDVEMPPTGYRWVDYTGYATYIHSRSFPNNPSAVLGGYDQDPDLSQIPKVSYSYFTRDITGLSIQIPNPPVTAGDLPENIQSHYYNLRNQTWADRRFVTDGFALKDPIQDFLKGAGYTKFPSNTDNVFNAYYPNASDNDSDTANRFHGKDLWGNPSGNLPAPKGYFIIDALSRSSSRMSQWKDLAKKEDYKVGGYYEYQDSSGNDLSLPLDETYGGATAVSEYAGRLWYGGFSGDGEGSSTRLESFLLYSQLTNSRSGYYRCYQENDPTSYESPDLVATDGGVVPLDGAYGIQRLVQVGNSLIIFAANGVWALSGEDGNLFSPTSQRVFKLTEKASVASRSIVVVDNTAYFWAVDGLYKITIDGVRGGATLENMSFNTIHNYYINIPLTSQLKVAALYDSYEGTISWYWNNYVGRSSETEVLRLKVSTESFSKYKIAEASTENSSTILAPIEVPPFFPGRTIDNVIAGEDSVIAGSDNVVATIEGSSTRPLGSKLIIAEKDFYGKLGIVFGSYAEENFLDWGETDAYAYLLTSYLVGEDSQKRKQTPYLTAHFESTGLEPVIEVDDEGNEITLELEQSSSCLLSPAWDWVNKIENKKFGPTREVYRVARPYIPEDFILPLDEEGFDVVSSRNKLRGRGRALSLKWETSPKKDCRLLGYGLQWQGNTRI